MSNFIVENTSIKDLKLGQIQSKKDERGYFERVYCYKEYEELVGRPCEIKQINRSLSKAKGTTRGLHFQWWPRAETKIVSCSAGSLFDVAVDLRKGSPTYLRYISAVLTPKNKKFLVIPEGFAHGFQTLEPDTEIIYLVTEEFSLPHDDGINPTDPAVGVKWPLDITLRSRKDTDRKYITDRGFSGIDIA